MKTTSEYYNDYVTSPFFVPHFHAPNELNTLEVERSYLWLACFARWIQISILLLR